MLLVARDTKLQQQVATVATAAGFGGGRVGHTCLWGCSSPSTKSQGLDNTTGFCRVKSICVGTTQRIVSLIWKSPLSKCYLKMMEWNFRVNYTGLMKEDLLSRVTPRSKLYKQFLRAGLSRLALQTDGMDEDALATDLLKTLQQCGLSMTPLGLRVVLKILQDFDAHILKVIHYENQRHADNMRPSPFSLSNT